MTEYEEWHMDLKPPTRVPPQSPPATFDDFKQLFLVVGRRVSKTIEDIHSFVFTISEDIPSPLKVSIRKVTPFNHDPPTNLLYPTSFDSWYNEYNQPLHSSQINKTRRPYRR